MTDPFTKLGKAPAEYQPLQDAKRSVSCAMTALRAAVHHKPVLGQQLGSAHALLSDVLRDLERVK